MLHMVWILLPGYIIANGMMIVVLLMDDIPKSEVPIIRQIVHSFNSRACKSQGSSPTRTVASGGKGSSYPLPPGPVELDTSSLWMDLFSLDSVILISVTCNCLPFSIFKIDSETYLITSAENSVSESPNLNIFLRHSR